MANAADGDLPVTLSNAAECLEFMPLWKHRRALEAKPTFTELLSMPARMLTALETLDWAYQKITDEVRKQEGPG